MDNIIDDEAATYPNCLHQRDRLISFKHIIPPSQGFVRRLGRMRLQARTLQLVYQSFRNRAKSTSATPNPQPSLSPVNQKRASNPFDNLGYQLIQDPSTSEPKAVQRSVIDALGPSSFTISGVRVSGSVLVMPFFSTLWNVDAMQHIKPNAFALVKLIHPRPDIVVVGTGAKLLPVSPQLREFFKDIHVNVDVMDTKNACHTFNVLNQEGRSVAAALLPVAHVERSNP